MGFIYPQPDNEHGFEQLCLRFYRRKWNNESLTLYGKRGEKQHGVDIFDPLNLKPTRAIQCKHHELTKTLAPSTIRSEVRKVENSHFEIDHYVIATTARKGIKSQLAVAELNSRDSKLFTVEVHFWEDICRDVSEFGRLLAEIIIYGEPFLAGAISETHGSLVPPTPASTTPDTGTTKDPYATIERLLDEGRLDAARHELEQLPDPVHSFQLQDQYKILRLRAKFELARGHYDSASDLFLRAFEASPDSEQSKQNRVLAYCLVGKHRKAYAIASKYIAEGLRTPPLISHLVGSAATRKQLAVHMSVVDEAAASDVSVNIALSHKYMAFELNSQALSAAERALQLESTSPHAHLATAMALHNLSVHDAQNARISRIASALQHYDTAEHAAREQRVTNLLPEIFVHRAGARALTGDNSGAAADYQAAVSAATTPKKYAERAIEYFLHMQDFDRAQELLMHLNKKTNLGQHFALIIASHGSTIDEKQQIIRKMGVLSRKNWSRAIEGRFMCVQWAIELKDFALAESHVDATLQKTHPFQAHTMLAWIRIEQGDLDGARSEATMALNESIRSAHDEELRLFSYILLKLKDDANAIGILDKLAPRDVLNDDTKRLIESAQRLRRHDLLLRICRELREADTLDEQLMKLEVELLGHYAPNNAMDLATQFIERSKTPSYFVAAKNTLAVRLDQLHRIDLTPSSLPSADELPPEQAAMVLLPYITLGEYDEPLKFLYQQRRKLFEDKHTHGRYIYFFITYGNRTSLRTAPSEVGPDTAVSLQQDDGSKRWIVIEDDEPVASRGEFSSDSELATSLVGRKPGDTAILPGNPVQPLSSTIGELQSKYVRAFQDSIEHFGSRFPGNSILQQVRVGDKESLDLSPVIENLQQRKNHVDACITLYREGPVSLFLFAESVGLSELDAAKGLAQHPDGLIRCSDASPFRLEQAASAGLPSRTIVLSVSAIVTLSLLDGWSFLDASSTYVVSQLSSEVVDAWLYEANGMLAREGGTLNLGDDGRLLLHEIASESRQGHLDQLNAIRSALDSRCERLSSLAVSELPPEKRSLYQDAIGLHNLEAICVARDRKAVLWTDDLAVSLVCNSDFQVSSVWTQLFLLAGVSAGTVDRKMYNLAVAKLSSWKYVQTIWSAETIMAAGAHAEWDPHAWPFRQCLDLIRGEHQSVSTRLQIALQVVKLLRRSDCIELKQSAIIQAVLENLEDVRAVQWMHSRIYQLFGVDIVSAEFVRAELEVWLAFH